MKSLFFRLINEQDGGEVIEYAIVGGLIVIGSIVLISAVGTKVVARWTAVNDAPL